MKVVSNTSPLIFLNHVDSLDILFSCFKQVLIPQAVAIEFGNSQLPIQLEVQKISKEGQTLVDLQQGALHLGELEAIQLAREANADLVLLDDLLARKKAKTRDVNVMGTLGVFLFASRSGHISPELAAQKIDILVNEYDMYIAPKLLLNIKQELKALE